MASRQPSEETEMDQDRKEQKAETPESRFSLYLGWCKRCGNCVEFCPTGALEKDEWGYPYLARPEKCTLCHMCEKLCPDFAISMSDELPDHVTRTRKKGPSPGEPGSTVSPRHSPERLAPEPTHSEEDDE